MSTTNSQRNDYPIESYFGEPLLDTSRRKFLERDPPNIIGFYHHRRFVYTDLIAHHDPWSIEFQALQRTIDFWQNRIQMYKEDEEFARLVESGWDKYRNRNPRPEDETIDQMNRRLFPSEYVLSEENNVLPPRLRYFERLKVKANSMMTNTFYKGETIHFNFNKYIDTHLKAH